MKRLNDLVILCSESAWLFVLSIVAAFGSLAFVLMNVSKVMQHLVGHEAFDMQNSLTVAQVFEQLPSYTQEAKQLYYAFSFADFFFPLFAALFMAGLAAFAVRHAFPDLYQRLNASSLFALLLIPAAFDWLENIFALTVISSFPEQRETAASLMIVAKKAKLASIVLAQVLVLIALGASAVKWLTVKLGAGQ